MKRWIALVTAAVCLAALAMPLQAAAQQSEGGGKLIALTFDDGPGRYTAKLLDALEERKVKATFFVLGCNAELYPDTVRRAYEQGHQIANHTYSHQVLTGQPDDKVKAEISKTTEILDGICGAGMTYLLRPPCGESNDRILALAGCPAVTWSVDPMDWRDQNAKTVAKRITEAAYDGAVILAHDLYASTVDGVIVAVDALLQEGYEFVTVNELFRRRGVTMKTGTVYGRCRPTGTQLPPISEPAFTVETSTDGVNVTIHADEGTAVYYTTDGTEPNPQSAAYSQPLVLCQPCTLRAVAVYNFNGSRSPTAQMQIQMRPSGAGENKQIDRAPQSICRRH